MYGYVAPLPTEHVIGTILLFVGFIVPSIWIGIRSGLPPLAAGAALAIGPFVLAWWTTPRGDGDGFWVFMYFQLAVLGWASALVVAAIQRIRAAHFIHE